MCNSLFILSVKAKVALEKVKQARKILFQAIYCKKAESPEFWLSSTPLKRAEEFLRTGRGNCKSSLSAY